MHLRELMSCRVLEASPDERLVDAAERMRDHDVGSLAVIEGGRLAGVLTERDILRAVAEGMAQAVTSVSAYMTPMPVVASPDTETGAAARIMIENDVRHLLVVTDHHVVGVVSARDLLALDAWPDETVPRD